MKLVSKELRRKSINIEEVKKEAYRHRSMNSLARKLNLNPTLIKNNLIRVNEYEEVIRILSRMHRD